MQVNLALLTRFAEMLRHPTFTETAFLHTQYPLVELDGSVDVGNGEDEVIEVGDFHRRNSIYNIAHSPPLRRKDFSTALSSFSLAGKPQASHRQAKKQQGEHH